MSKGAGEELEAMKEALEALKRESAEREKEMRKAFEKEKEEMEAEIRAECQEVLKMIYVYGPV